MKKSLLFVAIATAILYGCSASADLPDELSESNAAEPVEISGGETAPPPSRVDRDEVIALVGDVFKEPDGATDIQYKYEDAGVTKVVSMDCKNDGVDWEARYCTGVYSNVDIEPQMDEAAIVSDDNFGFDSECTWKDVTAKTQYIYYQYDKDDPDNFYYCQATWYYEDMLEVYVLSMCGPEPRTINPEEFFNY